MSERYGLLAGSIRHYSTYLDRPRPTGAEGLATDALGSLKSERYCGSRPPPRTPRTMASSRPHSFGASIGQKPYLTGAPTCAQTANSGGGLRSCGTGTIRSEKATKLGGSWVAAVGTAECAGVRMRSTDHICGTGSAQSLRRAGGALPAAVQVTCRAGACAASAAGGQGTDHICGTGPG